MKARALLAAALLLASCAAHAQVRASLVAAEQSVQPGRPVPVALRMDHEPHWHSYWLNAGTGYPTRLEWQLPPGWQAGDIQWPTPTLIKDAKGNVTGHGYDGVLYLPITLNAPANAKPGEQVTLKATASWLMCAEVCIPGEAPVSVTLPVAAQSPQPDSQVQAALANQSMPQDAKGWAFTASKDARAVTLQVSAPGALKDPHYYSESEFIQYDAPQPIVGEAQKSIFTLPIAEDADEIPERLTGLLAFTDAAGAYRSVKVDVPFTGASAAAGSGAVGAGSSRIGGPSDAALSVGVLALALLGGLILNLMPCVFPVLGIKVLGFVNEAGSDRRKVTLHGLMFTLGVLLSFWALAALLAALRAGGQQLGWGFQLQSAPFVFALTVVILVFALSLSGVFEFGLRATGVGGQLQMRSGFGGSFFTGVLATVVATPCSAPFLAPALGAALALPTAQSFVVFTFIGLGLSAPYLVLSIFPQAVNALPRPGRWMQTFKQVMAFPLYATVAYLIWVLAGQTNESGLLSALLGLTVIALGVWLYGHYNVASSNGTRVRLAAAVALALLVLGLNLGWPRAVRAGDIVWEPWSNERIAELQAEGRPVYVDFTARWCATCQANKKVVFSSNDVKTYFREHRVATLKADWTNSDPHITAELARWNRSAVPFNLVYLPGASGPKVLPEILTPSIVLNALSPET
jgi:thiol:disulfide interchange protein DsbD